MLRIAGVLTILVGLYVTLFLNDPNAMGKSNLVDVANRQGFFGVITLGVAVLIITGAIDLSMGSVIGLSAITFGMLMRDGVHPFLAMIAVLTGGALIGLLHGHCRKHRRSSRWTLRNLHSRDDDVVQFRMRLFNQPRSIVDGRSFRQQSH